jgi:hypothetical protein
MQQPPSSTISNSQAEIGTTRTLIASAPPPVSTNKRTSSLRSIQHKIQNQFLNLSSSKLNNSSNNIINSNTNSNNISVNITGNRTNTVTKQQLQNHAIRIANLEQKQANLKQPVMASSNVAPASPNTNTNYPNISIISQSPKHQNQNVSYQAIYQRNIYSNNSSLLNKNEIESNNSAISNSNSKIITDSSQSKIKSSSSRLDNNQDLIEQYDYI